DTFRAAFYRVARADLGEHSILRWLARTTTMPSGVGRPTSSCCRQQLSIQTGSRQYFLCVFAEGGNSRSWYELGCTHAKRHIQDQKAASRIRDFSQRRTDTAGSFLVLNVPFRMS